MEQGEILSKLLKLHQSTRVCVCALSFCSHISVDINYTEIRLQLFISLLHCECLPQNLSQKCELSLNNYFTLSFTTHNVYAIRKCERSCSKTQHILSTHQKKEHTDRRRCGDALHTLSTSKLKTGEWMQQMLCYQFICFVFLLLVLNDLVFFLLFIRKQKFH